MLILCFIISSLVLSCIANKASLLFPIMFNDDKMTISIQTYNHTPLDFKVNSKIPLLTICPESNYNIDNAIKASSEKLSLYTDDKEYKGYLYNDNFIFDYDEKYEIPFMYIIKNPDRIKEKCFNEIGLWIKNRTKSLITFLYEREIINHQVYTINLIDNLFELGEDTEKKHNGYNYTFLPMKQTFMHLSIPMRSFDFHIGKTNQNHFFNVEDKIAYIDLSKRYIQIPYEQKLTIFHEYFFSTNFTELPCTYGVMDDSYDIEVVCDYSIFDKHYDMLNTVTIHLDNSFSIELSKEDLYIKERRGYKLIFMFAQGIDHWVLGYEVFNRMVLKVDYEAMSIGVVKKQNNVMKEKYHGTIVKIYSICSTIICLCIVTLIICEYRERKYNNS